MVKGTSPDGQHLFPAFPYTSYQRMTARRRARPVRVSEDAAGGAGAIEAARRAVPVQHPPHARRLEVPVPRRQAVRSPIRPRTRPGIAAPIWSTVPATAPNAIRRAISSAASSTSQRFAGGPEPGGDGFVPNITQKGLSMSHERHRQAARNRRDARRRHRRRRDGRRSSPTPASSARRIARRWRPTSNLCRRSKGRSRRRAK